MMAGEISVNQQKFVFAGEMGSGKTTAIRSLSAVDSMEMEVPLSEEQIVAGKSETTVGFDFGVIELGGLTLFLYGTPGQAHLAVVANEILENCVGIVVLVNLSSSSPMEELQRWLELVSERAADAPIVVAANRANAKSPSLSRIRDFCAEHSHQVVAVQCVDPRKNLELRASLRLLTLSRLSREG
jgi:hypothetical protein